MSEVLDYSKETNAEGSKKMSFSKKIKGEIYRTKPQKMCCVSSRLKGLILFGATEISDTAIRLKSSNPDVVESFVEMAKRFDIDVNVHQRNGRTEKYTAEICDRHQIARLLHKIGMLDEKRSIVYRSGEIKKTCCKREFLKGAFLGAGAVSDPYKNYALEISGPNMELCSDVVELFSDLGFSLQLASRKKKYVAYAKNSETIQDILALFEAYSSQMEFINIKIEKEIRNDANRNANGETSNLSKTINASVDQIRAIYKIRDTVGLDSLPDDLKEIAVLRLEYKDLSLSELGKHLNPPLTKSGVNHRLKKIMNFAK